MLCTCIEIVPFALEPELLAAVTLERPLLNQQRQLRHAVVQLLALGMEPQVAGLRGGMYALCFVLYVISNVIGGQLAGLRGGRSAGREEEGAVRWCNVQSIQLTDQRTRQRSRVPPCPMRPSQRQPHRSPSSAWRASHRSDSFEVQLVVVPRSHILPCLVPS